MFFKRIAGGMLGSNCYIIGSNNLCAVIDPGVDVETVIKITDRSELNIKAIIITHAHYDHICYIDKLREITKAPVYAHSDESEALADSMANGSLLFGSGEKYRKADIFLKDKDILNIGDLKLEIIHTPGHTTGGICIKTNDFILTGDTLFRMSIGRTDLGRGDYDPIVHSIKSKLYILPAETVVYPGHGTSSTIGHEKKNNPYTI